MNDLEFYGTQAQVAVQERCFRRRHALIKDQRLSFNGRNFAIDAPTSNDIDLIGELAREYGNVGALFVTPETVNILQSELGDAGFRLDSWNHLRSIGGEVAACKAIVDDFATTDEYHFNRITPATSTKTLQEFQQLCVTAGVAPLPGYVLRGNAIPTVAVMAVTSDERIVACGAGVLRHHPLSQYASFAHVGFLATHPDHRGRGLGRAVLATVVLAVQEELGGTVMHTGVHHENLTSHAVCQACELQDFQNLRNLVITCPDVFGEGSFTK